MNNITEKMLKELKANNYDCAVAIATKEEEEAQAACGQLSIIIESEE